METGLSCQGHKSILASWFDPWISIFYYCTFLHRTSPKHLVGTFQRKESHSEKRLLFTLPLENSPPPTSLLSPKSRFPFPLIKHIPLTKKSDSYLQYYINVYSVSLMLFDLWVTSELLMAWGISISWSKTSGRQVLCQLPHHFASWPHSWHASWLLFPSHAKLCSGFEMNTNKLSNMLNKPMFEFKFQDEDIDTNLEICCNQIWAFQGHWISLL